MITKVVYIFILITIFLSSCNNETNMNETKYKQKATEYVENCYPLMKVELVDERKEEKYIYI